MKTAISITIDKDLVKKIDKEAKEDFRSRSQIIEMVLMDAF